MKVQQSPQLAKLLDPLDPEEAAVLHERMVADRTPQVFPYCQINGTNYQLDGHHRLPICVKERIKYSWVLIESVTTIAGAMAWIKANQLGRRNATPEQKATLRRERVQQMHLEGMSQRSIADTEGISRATVQNDLQKAQVATPWPPEENGTAETPKVTGKDGKTYPANGKKKRANTGPKPLTKKDWLSHWNYCNRGLDDFRERYGESVAPAVQKALDDARAALNRAYDLVNKLQVPA